MSPGRAQGRWCGRQRSLLGSTWCRGRRRSDLRGCSPTTRPEERVSGNKMSCNVFACQLGEVGSEPPASGQVDCPGDPRTCYKVTSANSAQCSALGQRRAMVLFIWGTSCFSCLRIYLFQREGKASRKTLLTHCWSWAGSGPWKASRHLPLTRDSEQSGEEAVISLWWEDLTVNQ